MLMSCIVRRMAAPVSLPVPMATMRVRMRGTAIREAPTLMAMLAALRSDPKCYTLPAVSFGPRRLPPAEKILDPGKWPPMADSPTRRARFIRPRLGIVPLPSTELRPILVFVTAMLRSTVGVTPPHSTMLPIRLQGKKPSVRPKPLRTIWAIRTQFGAAPITPARKILKRNQAGRSNP